jgi:hypothetical protein
MLVEKVGLATVTEAVVAAFDGVPAVVVWTGLPPTSICAVPVVPTCAAVMVAEIVTLVLVEFT